MIYREALKKWWHPTKEKYFLYVRFSERVDPQSIADNLGRKIKDFGSDRNNTLSMSFVYKNRCKNFMLEVKRLLLKDPDIKEVSVRKI